jgi:hypothetical protein
MIRFVLSVVCALFVSGASAQTPFPARNVLAGQTVVVPKGNYTLSQQVAVRVGGTLIIEAGTNISVVGLGLPIQVYGTLEVRGTSAEPVTMSPDASGICGTIAAYPTVGQPRPRITASYFDLITTRNSNSLFLSGCDFAISNSKITNRSTAASRVCVALANNSAGVLSSCFIDGCTDTLKTSVVGITLDSTGSSCDYIETIFANLQFVLKSSKQFTLASGSAE